VADRVYQRAVELLEADIGDELVALEPRAGLCFGFNPVATSVWQHLDAPRSFDEIKARLLAEYEVNEQQCTAELEVLLSHLLEKGLISCELVGN